MLTPKDTPTRETRVLDGTWRFAVDWDNDLDLATLTSEGLPGGLEIAVPASVNDLFADEEVRNHVGYWWYQRRVRVPRDWGEDQVLVHFGSATHAATVWVDGHEAGSFKGGYMPFEFDITDQVTAGEEFLLTVRVDNRLDNTCTPGNRHRAPRRPPPTELPARLLQLHRPAPLGDPGRPPAAPRLRRHGHHLLRGQHRHGELGDRAGRGRRRQGARRRQADG